MRKLTCPFRPKATCARRVRAGPFAKEAVRHRLRCPRVEILSSFATALNDNCPPGAFRRNLCAKATTPGLFGEEFTGQPPRLRRCKEEFAVRSQQQKAHS
jgi:hypothetical protein